MYVYEYLNAVFLGAVTASLYFFKQQVDSLTERVNKLEEESMWIGGDEEEEEEGEIKQD